MYNPDRSVPPTDSPAFTSWLLDELQRISTATRVISIDQIQLQSLASEPKKVYNGLTVYANGVDWNPNSGEGVYTFYNSTWNKLG